MISTTSLPTALRREAPRPETMIGGSEPSALPSADAEARRLAAAVARGDETAFRVLYDRYQDRLFRLVVVLGGGDEALAGEVVQSAMLTAAAKLIPVKSEAHLWHWLARVARQHWIKARRHLQREPMLVCSGELVERADPAKIDAVLDESLDAALLALGEADRRVIEWFYFDGQSHKEIAERLQTTPKAVSSLLERARVKLRALLTRILSHET
jgi:RNA polymerase sigma-70 factor (ECF subfamily)